MIVNANFFQRLDIVVDGHLLAADDRHHATLVRVEPTDVHHADAVVGKLHRQIADVVDVFGPDRPGPEQLTLVGDWPISSKMIDDVVRSEVPQRVDIAPHRAQIEPRRADVIDVAQLAAGRRFPSAWPPRPNTETRGPRTSTQPLASASSIRSSALVAARGQRLFDKRVQSGIQSSLGKRVMRFDRRGDDDGIDAVAPQHVRIVGRADHIGKPIADLASLFVSRSQM